MVTYRPKHRVQAVCGSHLSLFQKLWEDLPGSGFNAKLHILGITGTPEMQTLQAVPLSHLRIPCLPIINTNTINTY